MKRLSILASIVALGVVALVLPAPASASCGNPLTFNQGGYVCPGGYYCYILSGATGSDDIASLQADFWALGTGDPAVGSGDDDGSRANSDWLTRFGATYPIYMRNTNNWSQPNIDGCIENPAAPGTEKMIALFSDQATDGSTSYWAVAGALRVPADSPQFNFKNNPASDIAMVEAPLVQIVASRKISDTVVEVDVACPNLSAGFYSDGNVLFSEAVQGCAIFQQQLTVGSAGPTGAGSRATSNWTSIGTVASGSTGTVTLSGCNAVDNFSNYLAAGVAFDSGFTTNFVGANSNRVDCGPNVANPTPRFKIIDRDPKGKGRLQPKEPQ